MERRYKSVDPTPESLGNIGVFQGLDRADREMIATQCYGGRFERNQEVLSYGDESRDIYFIVSGTVRATIYSRSGKEVTFRDIGSGKVFGDLSAIDGRPRSANEVHAIGMPAAVDGRRRLLGAAGSISLGRQGHAGGADRSGSQSERPGAGVQHHRRA